MRKNEQKIKKTNSKNLFKGEVSLSRLEIKNLKGYNLLIC